MATSRTKLPRAGVLQIYGALWLEGVVAGALPAHAQSGGEGVPGILAADEQAAEGVAAGKRVAVADDGGVVGDGRQVGAGQRDGADAAVDDDVVGAAGAVGIDDRLAQRARAAVGIVGHR